MSHLRKNTTAGSEAKGRSSSSESSLEEDVYEERKSKGFSDEGYSAESEQGSSPPDLAFRHELHRGLKGRQIAMVGFLGLVHTKQIRSRSGGQLELVLLLAPAVLSHQRVDEANSS
jgi:hypothetical protein